MKKRNNAVGKFVEPFTDKEVIRIKKALAKNNEKRNFCLFTLGINQGVRTTELLSLKIRDVEKVNVGDRIYFSEQKTGKQNFIQINEVCFAAIQYYLSSLHGYGSDDYLFKSRNGNEPITIQQLGRLIKDWCQYARIRDPSKYGARSLRKTFAAMNYESSSDKIDTVLALQKRFNHKLMTAVYPYLGTMNQPRQKSNLFCNK